MIEKEDFKTGSGVDLVDTLNSSSMSIGIFVAEYHSNSKAGQIELDECKHALIKIAVRRLQLI